MRPMDYIVPESAEAAAPSWRNGAKAPALLRAVRIL